MKRRVLFPFEFRAGESARAGVLRLVGFLHRQAESRVDPPAPRQERAVHEMRVLLKRVRALIRLVRPGLKPAQARRLTTVEAKVRTAARGLADARDGAVALSTLGKLLKQASQGDQAKLEPLRTWCAARFQARAQRSGTVTQALRAAPAAVAQAGTTLAAIEWPSHGWRVLEDGWHDSYRRARRRLRRAAERGKAELFHDARTCVKRLMYQVQWLSRLSPEHAARLAQSLDDLQDLLGEDHDLSVLEGLLRRVPARLGAAGARRRLQTAITRRQLKLRRRATRLARTAFRERPSAFVSDLHRDRHRRRAAR